MLKIIKAEVKDIPTIQELSNIVWPITFANILSPNQIKYMMEMMYSTESLQSQMKESELQYFLIRDQKDYLGYLSIQHFLEESFTKIHKIYVLPYAQTKGVGRALIEHAKQHAIDKKSNYLTLNVNRYNHALKFYKHLGFSVAGVEDIDIGNDFLMEDYILKLDIT